MENRSIRKIFNYSVPIIVFIVAIFQFIQTRNGLTRWKGGGFGMYTELNYPHREVWIVLPDTTMNVRFIPEVKKKYGELINRVKRYPNKKSVGKLSEQLSQVYPDSFQIQVWTPYVDAQNQKWCKRLIYE